MSSIESTARQRIQLYQDAARAASWGLSINLALLIAKLLGGILAHSNALLADAVNSGGDVATCIVVRAALWMAQQEEDADHPYGHSKAETIAGLTISVVIIVTSSALALETLIHLSPSPSHPSRLVIGIAFASGMIKEALFHYTQKVANRLDSHALRSAAWDHRCDAICSATIALGLLLAPWLGPIAPYADDMIALGVCALLIGVGIYLFRQSGMELMDQQADPQLTMDIRQTASETEDVIHIEKLRVRKSGLEYFVEIHVQVLGCQSVNEGHRIGHHVKDRLMSQFPRIRDVHVHIEPNQ